MKRRFSIAALLVASIALSATLGSGCAYRRADRSLVQPMALDKKQFNGEWYYMKTIYKTPYESGFFEGQGGWPLGTKIRWEVTESYLYAFNASPNVRNTDSAVTPLAAWPISTHFDIKPMINYSTGEPSNVIVEEMSDGLPWHQRKYMRVHWERSQMSDWTDIFTTYYRWIGLMRFEPAVYVPPEKFEIAPNYMTYVSDEIVTRSLDDDVPLINLFLLEIPISSYRLQVRHAFRKIEQSSYTPKEYNDYMFNKFGAFRTTVVRFHPDRGLVDWSYKFYANRHNVASQEELDTYAKNNTPKEQQKPSKIIYYLSPGFPADTKEAMQKVAAGWDEALRYGLKRKDTVFEIRDNNYNPETGKNEANIRRELGDLRYNYVWWVNSPQSVGLLGYGPSLADPDTGEIVHGSAYIYAALFRIVTDSYMTLFDLLSGRYKDEDVANGLDYLNSVYALNGLQNPLGLTEGSQQKYVKEFEAPKIGLTKEALESRVLSAAFSNQMKELGKLDRSQIQARVARIENNPRARQALLNDHVLALAFPNLEASDVISRMSSDKYIQNVLERYHPLSMMSPLKVKEMEERQHIPSRLNMYMAGYADEALDKFVEYHVAKKTPREEVRKRIQDFLVVAVTAHEVGHSLGMTHNFKGSSDEYNYANTYHDLKAGQNPTNCNGTQCPADMLHKDFYRNSSIMDYAGEYYNDNLGVGKTDRATMAFLYGGYVEKAVDDPRKQGELIKWDMEVERKNLDPQDALKLRPFRFCSDYSIGQDPFCQRRDAGANAKEIIDHAIASYDRTYILKYFRRGRRDYWLGTAIFSSFFRFSQVAEFFQDWVNRVVTQPDYRQTADFADKLEAVQKGFAFLNRVLSTPHVGQQVFDPLKKMHEGTTYVPPDNRETIFNLPLGIGKHFYSAVNDGYYGIFRYRRTGFLYDKWFAMQALSIRSWGHFNNQVGWIFTNFYDVFREDSINLFSQGISGIWDPANPILVRYKDAKSGKTFPVEPAWHPFLQQLGMIYGLVLLNNEFTDRTFTEYMHVGIRGNEKEWTPPMGAKTLSFKNYLSTREYIAVQTRDNQSIAWKMVERGRLLAAELQLLKCCTPNVSRAEIERKEGELELLETNLTLMQYFTSLYE